MRPGRKPDRPCSPSIQPRHSPALTSFSRRSPNRATTSLTILIEDGRSGRTAADFPGDARLDLTDEFFTREFGLFARCSDNGQPKTSAHAD
jgi:hypothetical protein